MDANEASVENGAWAPLATAACVGTDDLMVHCGVEAEEESDTRWGRRPKLRKWLRTDRMCAIYECIYGVILGYVRCCIITRQFHVMK